MKNFSRLTNHAIRRLGERTNLSISKIIKLLNFEKYALLNDVDAINIQHKLIYDNDFFVVIQNKFTGKVITILHQDFYEKSYGKIDENKLRTAIECRKIAIK